MYIILYGYIVYEVFINKKLKNLFLVCCLYGFIVLLNVRYFYLIFSWVMKLIKL